VVLGPDGVLSFAALQDALWKSRSGDLVYLAFDLFHLDGLDLRPLPLIERKVALKKLLGGRRVADSIRYSDHVRGQGEAFYAHACPLGLEGILSKLGRSPCRARRTSEWLKIKCHLRQEMVIGGWQESDKQGRSHALMSQSLDLLVKATARWAGLKTYLQLAVAARQLRYQPLDHRRLVRDLSEKADLALAAAFRDRHRMPQLRRIQPDKTLAILPHGSSPMPEARLGPPEQPSILFGMKGRATG
jgi:hypothetical protein